MARSFIVIGTLFGLLVGLTSRAGAQAFPPCTDLGPDPPSITAYDLDDNTNNSGFTATHTIRLALSEGSAPYPTPDESAIQWSLPPSTTQVQGLRGPRKDLNFSPTGGGIFVDNAGSYAITATWPHDDGITQCTATASMNLQVQPAAPLRLSNIYKKRGPVLTPGWDWRVIFGPHSDLRPIQILMRGVRRARFPTGPFRTYNAAVRSGDPNWNDGDQRFLKLPRWGLSIEADNRFLAIDGKLRSGSTHEKPVGYEVKVIQAGRQLGDIRAAGKCGIFDCVLKNLKVQR